MTAITLTNLMPTIISTADATHYLVGLTDRDNNFIGFPPSEHAQVLSSFAQAKQYLKDRYISHAVVEYQSAYDEMCGNQSVARITEKIIL